MTAVKENKMRNKDFQSNTHKKTHLETAEKSRWRLFLKRVWRFIWTPMTEEEIKAERIKQLKRIHHGRLPEDVARKVLDSEPFLNSHDIKPGNAVMHGLNDDFGSPTTHSSYSDYSSMGGGFSSGSHHDSFNNGF